MGIIPILPTLFTVHPQPRPMGCSLGKNPLRPRRGVSRGHRWRDACPFRNWPCRWGLSVCQHPRGWTNGGLTHGSAIWVFGQWSNLFKTQVFVSSQILFESSKMQTMCCCDPLNLSNDLQHVISHWYAYLYETSKSYTFNQPSKAKLTSPIISMNCSNLAT